MNDLNAVQQQAVEAKDGPLLIVAGPGTGKTKTLTARIAYLVASGRAKPEQILALTFTKKAAEEMRGRVLTIVGKQAQTPHISTFHALCHELLGDDSAFVSDPVRLQIIKKLPRPADLKGLSARELGLLISRAKNMAEDGESLGKVVSAYNAALAEQGLMDFDDLLVRARDKLQQDDLLRAKVQAMYTHILVDEFQDTNRLQYGLLQLLRGNDNVFVIGDPQQSIYGFRGSSGDIFRQFAEDFPGHKAITLTTNYRSAPEVVRLSNAIFADSPALKAHHETSGQVRAVEVLNEYSEANWIVSEIQRAIGGGDLTSAVSDDYDGQSIGLRDVAILYRSRAAAAAVQKAVAESGLPYQVVGDGSPYEQPKTQAIIALLKSVVTSDDPALLGYTAATIKAVQDRLRQSEDAVPSALAEQLIRLLGFERTPSLAQLVNSLVRFNDLTTAVAHFDAIAEQAFYDPQADAITLLTVHASKGLEFPYVFLVGAEEGSLPHARADVAEEKRLFYVAATRAVKRLDILHARRRGGADVAVSRFVGELPDDVLPKVQDPRIESDARRAQKRQIKRSQQSLF